MSLPIYDLTPWDKVVQWGNAYHGHWRKNADGSIDPISGLTGEIIPVDPATMSKSVNTGPCWLTRFPGLQMPATTQAEAAAGMYWTNYAVWSGLDLVYNSIINHPVITMENKKLLDRSTFEFVYRCSDNTVWWIFYNKNTKKLYARIPRIQSSQPIFDMAGYDLVTWRNFSESGKKAAFGIDFKTGNGLNGILEINISGGSATELPTVTPSRFREWSNGPDRLKNNKIIISEPDVEIIDNADPSKENYPSFGGMNVFPSDPESEIASLPVRNDYNDWYLINGLAHYTTTSVFFVDYDVEDSVDVGLIYEYFNEIEEKFVPLSNGHATLSCSSSTKTTNSIFRGNQKIIVTQFERLGPHPINLDIPPDPDEYAAAELENRAQVISSCPINVGEPLSAPVGPIINSFVVNMLFGKYIVLTNIEVPYVVWQNEKLYSYGTKARFYGFSSAKSIGVLPVVAEMAFNEFSINPVTGEFTPGIIGYF